MNKKLIIIATFSLLVIGGVAFSAANQDPAEAPPYSSTNQQNPAPSAPETTSAHQPASGAGKYIEYSPAVLAEATTNQKVLFFHAPWCPQCRSIESGINKDGVPAGFTIIKVDYDSNQTLRKKYGITLQTSFAKIDSKGDLIKKYVAYDEPTFDSVKRNFLLN